MTSATPPRTLSPDRTFAEQIVPGQELALGEYAITAGEIKAFGRAWDPLPLHVDESLAEGTAFGTLIASGIHTLSVYQRLSSLAVYSTWNVFAGRRLDDVRFLAPVFPGDILSGSMVVDSVLLNHPGRALVSAHGWLDSPIGRVLELTTETYVNRAPLS